MSKEGLILWLLLTGIVVCALAPPGKADEQSWGNGVSWSQGFPEHEMFGAFAPSYAASFVGANVRSPEWLIQQWHRLPNNLRQWDCGADSLGQSKRCLDETFQGSGEYAGTSITAHFDTIVGSWHFMGFDVR